jgi:hypothetical protein
MNKQFKDILEGELFKHNNLEYKKIAAVKVSCCRSINAEETTNTNNKIFIQPLIEVEINDQL